MRVGDFAEVERAYTAQDMEALQALGGVSAGDCIPEPLLGALFSYLLGVRLPGPGTNYLKQQTRFLSLARIGERLRARVEVVRLRPDKHLADFETVCVGEDERVVCRGRALVYVAEVAANQGGHD